MLSEAFDSNLPVTALRDAPRLVSPAAERSVIVDLGDRLAAAFVTYLPVTALRVETRPVAAFISSLLFDTPARAGTVLVDFCAADNFFTSSHYPSCQS